jgi:hypothetical protein
MKLNIGYTPNCRATVRRNEVSTAKVRFENEAGWDVQEEDRLKEFITPGTF